MATPAKRASPSKPERSAKVVKPAKTTRPLASTPSAKPTKPSKATADPEPHLRFHHAVALRVKTLSLLGTLELAEDATAHRDALSALVVELTNSGLDAYFMTPLRQARAGFIVEQSAKLGMVGVQQVMGSVVRQIIGRMDGPQLISVSASIRQFMR